MRTSLLVSLALVTLVGAPFATAHAARTWHVDQGTATLAFDDSHLSDLGLRIVGERSTATASGEVASQVSGTLRSFALDPAGLSFTSDHGLLTSFAAGQPVSLPVHGGLAIGAKDGAARPVFLYDFNLEIDRTRGMDAIVLRTADPSLPQPLDVTNAGFLFRESLGEVAVCFADVQISTEWARALGHPELAGQLVGSLDLRLHGSPDPLGPTVAVAPAAKGLAPRLDVTLGQLYGITGFGRVGAYPAGRNGLSFATTSCNTGDAIVPWNGPMAETHPFIGLALFRRKDGVLEQIGTSWIKHGFYALSNNDCQGGCPQGSDGSYLALGCSDTYSASNNASQYYLGPRPEVNPFIAVWEACGSFFDEPLGIPDAAATAATTEQPNGVNHRLECGTKTSATARRHTTRASTT
jgi:hypothetical protein